MSRYSINRDSSRNLAACHLTESFKSSGTKGTEIQWPACLLSPPPIHVTDEIKTYHLSLQTLPCIQF